MSKQAYKVLERSFIHDRLYEPDETVVIDGPAGPNLQKLDGKEAAKAKAAVDDTLLP